MLSAVIAAVLAASSPEGQAQPQTPGVVAPPIRLEDIEVRGRTLDLVIQEFVDNVGAPNRRRNLARWNTPLCVGVSSASLTAETAQHLVDRVSTIAQDIGLETGAPGCRPNVLVATSSRPNELAAAMVARASPMFRPGGSGMDRGRTALRSFLDSQAPVRWWAVSAPTDSVTGGRAVRIPGECQKQCGAPKGQMGALDFAPNIHVTSVSRITTQIVDDMMNVIVVIDEDQISGLTVQQLADYVGMVSLAQINPDAETATYYSILNVFHDSGETPGLTDWDNAYLRGLYSSQRTHMIAGANRSEVVSSIRREHSRLQGGSNE